MAKEVIQVIESGIGFKLKMKKMNNVAVQFLVSDVA